MTGTAPRRVVITGLGAVTGFGCGVRCTWEGVLAGRSALREYFPLGDLSQPPEVAGEVDLRALPAATAGLGRAARFGLVAAEEAWRDAALPLPSTSPESVGVCIGASTFPVIEDRLDRLSSLLKDGAWDPVAYAALCRERPSLLTQSDAAGIASRLSDLLGARGPSLTVQAACTSATQAIGHAFQALRAGEAHLMLTGGTDSMLSMMCVTGFRLLGSLAQRWDSPARASRPFDRTRDGFVLAEGAAMLVLEDLDHALARGARIYAELAGYGSSCDAFRFTDMEPAARGPVQCMRDALRDAKIVPTDVGYINAHGTATPLNDRLETLATREVFGAHADAGLAVSSTKSQLGHLLCAAGAIELVLTTLAVHEGILPPTLNLREPDPECDLDYIRTQPRPQQVEYALSNSFGFGGQNGSLVVRRWTSTPHASTVQTARKTTPRRVCITGIGVQSPLGLGWPEHRSGWHRGRSGLRASSPELARLSIPLAGRVPIPAPDETAGPDPRPPLRNRMLRKLLTRSATHAVLAAGEALRSSALSAESTLHAELFVGSLGLDQDLQVFVEALAQSLEPTENAAARFSYARFRRHGVSLIDPLFLVRSLPNAGLCGTAIEFNLQGRNLNLTSGSTSGLLALGAAAASVARGDTPVALAGGYDSLLGLETALAHAQAGFLSSPGGTTGYAPSEGAVFFVLEELSSALARGAPILGEVLGWGSTHTAADALLGEAAAGLECAARQSLAPSAQQPSAQQPLAQQTAARPFAVFGDGLCLPAHDALETAVLGRLGILTPLQTTAQRLGYAGGVTGLFSTLHALDALQHQPGPGPALVWTSDRGRNHAALTLGSLPNPEAHA